ncbi:aldehyde dehydrogenase family protein [Chelatococcus asaccharovorans]|uniref:aldehyde dehydrogenase family protein n=1 Tax=Chelatococcus asaccharovorans TaxID=28210 RepID=UPI00224C67FB|nr:aldehyde dehydrogenase family protein [Chelatococcus asaccharovorans]CAH1656086.1 3-succinoylsemialdehyde-pyridine dehydrogenase [Chelatococcus asaccharovorans]CAH1685225.1 3-succinoylsemialdehyde-pyridine dehydrogenase [Chelatococcus asaccharovorans]
MQIARSCFINGQWVAPDKPTSFTVTNSATGAPWLEVPLAGVPEAEGACKAARAAFAGWSDLDPAVRAGYLGRIADELEARQAEIAVAVSREVGMPLKLSERIQVAAPILAWRRLEKASADYQWTETIGNSLVERVAAGVAICITPWNYPLHQITGKVAPALLAGCTVVLKPSELAPTAAILFAEAIEAAQLPAGVLNMVIGAGADVGAALVASPEADVISFTGSTAVGRQIGAKALSAVKRVTLELGGKSASVLLPGADVTAAVKSTMGSCFLNSGQTCSALTRFVVPAAQQEEVLALISEAVQRITVGDPLDPNSRMGPLVSKDQQERVRRYISKGIESGARLVCGGAEQPGGNEAGHFVSPTVFADVDPASAIAQEEIFGPVLCIIPYRDIDEAVAIANGTPYGLAGAVWGPDDALSLSVARRIRAGQVDINGGPFNLDAPFGGFGMSGVGRENGRFGLDDFLEYRSLQQPQRKG